MCLGFWRESVIVLGWTWLVVAVTLSTGQIRALCAV